MGREKKISDEQLEKEIRNGKNQKQIAHDYGYQHPSRALSQRIQKLGYRKNNKLSVEDWGGAKISVPSGVLNDCLENHAIQLKGEGSASLFFYAGVHGEDQISARPGDIVIRPTTEEWRKEE